MAELMSLSLEKAHSYTRMALPLMGHHGIPTTPMNYSIWYNYVTGENPKLKETIDIMLKHGDQFTEEKNKVLYSKFCALYDEVKIKKLQEGLTMVLITLASEVQGLSIHTEDYEKLLSRSMVLLSDDRNGEKLGVIIQDIIDETKSLVQYGKTIQQKLEQTTQDLEALQQEYEHTKKEAAKDPLTGIANRKAFMEEATQVIRDANTRSEPLALIMADIDYFKYFNDTHGHLVGDEVLKFVAKKIKSMVKGQDFVARLGGEEFVILLPRTGFAGALHVAEQIRSYFDLSELKSQTLATRLGKVTLSLGLAMYEPGETLEALIDRSDKSLYLAKEKGRNRVATQRDLETANTP
ncbi:MAG: diguanylate cyclase [Proteobacteria bacterium]|nr:diguanylate cyclase [Pseudomonadota bacterium]